MVVSQRQDSARQLTPGSKLGKYNLIRPIAIGGMAELYLARTVGIEGFEKLVVVKRILPQYAEDAQFIQMFLDEARLAATLHHPNIAQVYDIGIERGSYFFSMEYVHGEDLRRIMATSADHGVPVSLDAALTLIVGVAGGLHYAHQKAAPDGTALGIVHRDVSPSNVLVSYEGGVKVVDFGIARATGKQAETLSGGLKGKIAYMSPEQCRGGIPLDRRSDIFSIGSMLYELSTGSLPFEAETEFQVMTKIVNEDVVPPTRRVPAYPPQLEAIVLRAMARDPNVRYGTALELQRALEDFAHENRLRISPLTLSAVMERMFPAALAEWEKARSQGAYFVEEHVLKTLVGKTTEYTGNRPFPNDEDTQTQQGPPVPPLDDDDKTDIVTALPPPPPPQPPAAVPMAPPVMTAPPAVASAPRTKTPPPGALPPAAVAARMTPVPGTLAPVAARRTPPPGSIVPVHIPPVAAPATIPPPRAELLAPSSTEPATQPEVSTLVGAAPAPAMPTAHPAALAAAAAVVPISEAGDMTAKVTVLPRYAPPERTDTVGTDSVYTERRASRSILIAFGLIVAAGAVAAVTVMVMQRSSPAPSPAAEPEATPVLPDLSAPTGATDDTQPAAPTTTPPPAPTEATPPPATAIKTTPPPAPATKTAPPPATTETEPEPDSAATKPATPTTTAKASTATTAKHGKRDRHTGRHDRVRKKPDPTTKPAAETKKPDPPKEKTWSDDSPFMPVRTDK